MRLSRIWTVPVLLLLAAAPARADLSYSFADTSGNPATSFPVHAGESIDLQVYVVGTGSDATLLDSVGLLAAGVEVDFAGIPDAHGPGGAVELTAIVGGPGFLPPPPDPVIDNTDGFGTLPLLADPFSPALGTGGEILLGTFTFHALAEGMVGLRAISQAGLDNFLLGDLSTTFNIDTPATADLRVEAPQAVPEPSTLLLFPMAGVAGLWHRLRTSTSTAGGPGARMA
jgi:hypothetical protein